MKRTKKGFTIVELVVVIAVIAILAGVLVPTFSNLIKRAQTSKDEQLVRNLNTALSLELEKPATMHEALEIAQSAGYIVEKINASNTDLQILWDSKNNLFCYFDGTSKYIYVPGFTPTTNPETYEFWGIFTSLNDSNRKKEWSIYASEDFVTDQGKVPVHNVGFDSGNNPNIKEVNYTGDSGHLVVIRTNSAKTSISLDALDTIHHYGVVGSVDIIRTANASYHENGTAAFIQVASGRVVAEKGAKIEAVVLTEKGADAELPAILENNGGEIAAAYATSEDVIEANNADAKSVQLTVAENKVEFEEGATAEETAQNIAAAINTIRNDVVDKAVKEESGEVAVEVDCYIDNRLTEGVTKEILGYTAEDYVFGSISELTSNLSTIYKTGETLKIGLVNENGFYVTGQGVSAGVSSYSAKDVAFYGLASNITILQGYPTLVDGEYGSCYTFDGVNNLSFYNLIVKDQTAGNYRGFVRCNNIYFEKCSLYGQYTYLGTKSTKMVDCYLESTDYIMWAYAGDKSTYEFEGCTFKSENGKFINAYNETKSDSSTVSINIDSCSFLCTGEGKTPYSAILIKDNQNYIVNINNSTTNFTSEQVDMSKVTGYKAGTDYSNLYLVSKQNNTRPLTKVTVDGVVVYEVKSN